MRQDTHTSRIECVSPGTDDRLDVPFSDLGITKEVASAMVPVIIGKETSAGAADTIDETAALDLSNERLTISEGSNGFADGDIYTVQLVTPQAVVAGTSRASA